MSDLISHAFPNGDYEIFFAADGVGRVVTTALNILTPGSIKLLDEKDIMELEAVFTYAASRIRGRRKGEKPQCKPIV